MRLGCDDQLSFDSGNVSVSIGLASSASAKTEPANEFAGSAI